MRYHLTWLTGKFERGEPLDYIFFSDPLGKTSKQNDAFILSQWYYSTFSVNEIVFKSAGHWMMARKAILFGDRESFKKIIDADRLEDVKFLGRNIKRFEDVKWSEWKYEIVREGNFHKFNQNKKLRTYLLNTKDAVLAEANISDRVWGIGLSADSRLVRNPYAWNGLNLLGFALMEIREYLRNFTDLDLVRDGRKHATDIAASEAPIIF